MKNAALFSGALVTPSSVILGTSAGIGVGSVYGFSDKPGSENGLAMVAVENVVLKLSRSLSNCQILIGKRFPRRAH